MVWPIPFLINTFAALKGSQFNFYFTGEKNLCILHGQVFLMYIITVHVRETMPLCDRTLTLNRGASLILLVLITLRKHRIL